MCTFVAGTVAISFKVFVRHGKRETVYGYFRSKWSVGGVWERIHDVFL